MNVKKNIFFQGKIKITYICSITKRKMGTTDTTKTLKSNSEMTVSKDSRLRKLILSTVVKPMTPNEYKKSRLNAYKAVR